MELNKEQYTKQEVEEMLNALNLQIAQLTTDLASATEQVKEVETLKTENLNNSIKLEMVKVGINEDMFDLVASETLENAKSKIEKLMDLQKKQMIDNSYKPQDHNNDDNYSNAEKQGNVEGMLKSKFNKLFQ